MLKVNNVCPVGINELYFTNSSEYPGTTYPGTSWTKVENACIRASGGNYNQLGSYIGSDTSVSIVAWHNHGTAPHAHSVGNRIGGSVNWIATGYNAIPVDNRNGASRFTTNVTEYVNVYIADAGNNSPTNSIPRAYNTNIYVRVG